MNNMEPKNNSPKKPSMAGGFFMAAGLLIGAITGVAIGQPSAGMITGLVIGGAIALGIWFLDRSR